MKATKASQPVEPMSCEEAISQCVNWSLAAKRPPAEIITNEVLDMLAPDALREFARVGLAHKTNLAHTESRKQAAAGDLRRNVMDEVGALSISQAARRAGIGRTTFYRMLAAGHGPRTLKIGVRRLVRPEALEAWLREREAETARHESVAER